MAHDEPSPRGRADQAGNQERRAHAERRPREVRFLTLTRSSPSTAASLQSGAPRTSTYPAPTTTIDAHGVAIAPGLIDSHVHPVAGDWTPRQSQLNWIDLCLHGGVTTMVSAGEVHTPGRPRDIVGLKAMAITAQRCFSNFRASGVKVHAGAPVIEPGMEEHDFEELAISRGPLPR